MIHAPAFMRAAMSATAERDSGRLVLFCNSQPFAFSDVTSTHSVRAVICCSAGLFTGDSEAPSRR